MLVDAGIDVPLFTADGDWLFQKGGIPAAFAAANGEMNYDSLTTRVDRFNEGVGLYMFHGGTNFGFTSGANYTRAIPIEPSMTSYDYDAPLSKAGWPTTKYYALRHVIRRNVSYAIPDVPDSLPVIAVPPIHLAAVSDLAGIIDRVAPVNARERP